MWSSHAARRFGFAIACLFAAIVPAKAEIEKFMRHCNMALCPYFHASTTVPEGWAEHKEASAELKVQMLVPKDKTFDDAPAKIYTLVRYNPEKKPLAEIVRTTYQDWRERDKNAKVAKLADVPGAGGKAVFERHSFEAPKQKEQGFELTSLTVDTDKDGNSYFVAVVLSANSKAELNAAEAAYLSILKAY